jgi:hypothetical protein
VLLLRCATFLPKQSARLSLPLFNAPFQRRPSSSSSSTPLSSLSQKVSADMGYLVKKGINSFKVSKLVFFSSRVRSSSGA